tara:strand:+ start:256 stop:1011 length:756 start_codon:yes stop_codon:yes gene_type:complete
MNYKFFIIFFLFLYSCNINNTNKINKKDIVETEVYSNRGFTLLFSDDLKKKKLVNKKIDERSLIIFQKNIKKNTNVKITNLLNNKSILAKVGSKTDYPNFFNSVVSKRIYMELELDDSEPYVEVKTITENSTFFAKKAKMYDEEKQVAEKAPVEGISINDLSKKKEKKEKKEKKDNFNYIIKVADFYYENTAILMQKRIIDELNIKKAKISKISNTNFRVYFGPFDNIKSLKKAFDDITPLNFENIEILKL